MIKYFISQKSPLILSSNKKGTYARYCQWRTPWGSLFTGFDRPDTKEAFFYFTEEALGFNSGLYMDSCKPEWENVTRNGHCHFLTLKQMILTERQTKRNCAEGKGFR